MRVLIGNAFSEVLVGRYGRTRAQWKAQKLLWWARPGDVLVLPGEPDHDFLDYALRLRGVDPGAVRVVVPPDDEEGDPRLTRGRLLDERLHATLRGVIGVRPVETVLAFWPDTTVSSLADAIGAKEALSGYAFMTQSGGTVSNSKAVFRAVAAGVGAPVPDGVVCVLREEAEQVAWAMLAEGRPVMLKGEYFMSGDGNVILGPDDGFPPLGARTRIVTVRPDQVTKALADHWDRLTGAGRYRLVVEEYHPGCTSLFAEFLVTDSDVVHKGDGELLKDPQGVGQIMPFQGQPADVRRQLLEGGAALSQALRAVGYRGIVSADAVVTPDRQVLFTEYNGRTTSSTHIYEVIGKELVGERYPAQRVLFEKVQLKAPSFAEALRRLRACGLAYDRTAGHGVVLTSAYESRVSNLNYCAVGEDLASVLALSREVDRLVADPAEPGAR
ncbi:hypothetical protein GCM10010145_48390 [Streptomyces ruber]|uniref:ATP-grasp domain-containing protein n=2 Tax=Streptomyces TaxID=1883 RepID=A0A918BJ70_9ACTN|nr:peptide ligase PGM1-related protein [Streptomyces ruber]GGQ72997.1 hypothetical protein GCM10010145_48390 [Streptomyces ruber]